MTDQEAYEARTGALVFLVTLMLAVAMGFIIEASNEASSAVISDLSTCELDTLARTSRSKELFTNLDVRRARSSCEVTPKKVEVASQRQQIEALLKEKRASEALK